MPQLNFKNGSSWVLHRDIFYPVGAVFISRYNTSPASLYGGQWNQLADGVLGTSTDHEKGTYFGSDTHTITEREMPPHAHGMDKPLLFDAGWFTPTDGLAHPDNGSGGRTPFGNGHVEMYKTGGGKQCLLSKELTTSTFGYVPPRVFWGGVIV